MSQVDESRAVAMLAALSQPTRLRIVQVIAEGTAEGTPAGEIARAVHCPASTLSFHLKELSQAGFLSAHPQGRFIRYAIVPEAFALLSAFITALAGADAAPTGKSRVARRSRPGRKARGSKPAEGQLSIFED